MRLKVDVDRGTTLVLSVLNDLFLLEKRMNQTHGADKLFRYTNRIKEHFAEFGYVIEDPTGEKFSETRTDCEASIAGRSTENLVIKDVLKPVIRLRKDDMSVLVQRAIVIGGIRFRTAQITLDKVAYGNLTASSVDSADFNR